MEVYAKGGLSGVRGAGNVDGILPDPLPKTKPDPYAEVRRLSKADPAWKIEEQVEERAAGRRERAAGRKIGPKKTREMLTQARQRMLSKISGQPNSSKWLAMAQGFLSPTQTGGFGESLGNVANLVGQVNVRNAQMERRDLDRQLAENRYETEQFTAEQNRGEDMAYRLEQMRIAQVKVDRDKVMADRQYALDQQKLLASSGKLSKTQQLMISLQADFGVDEQTAFALANRLTETVTDPITGISETVSTIPGHTLSVVPPEAANLVAAVQGEEDALSGGTTVVGAVQPIVEGQRPGRAAGVPDVTMGMDVIEEITGPVNALARFGESIPALGDVFTGEGEIQAKTIMDSLNIDIESAFAKNPRFPEGEVKRLQKLLPKGGFFSTKSATQSSLKGLRGALESNLYNESQAGNNQSLPVKTRRDALNNAMRIENLIGKLDQVLAASVEFSPEELAAELRIRGLK